MTPIKYIGHRDPYKDGACGSDLVFSQGQTINVEDDDVARKMLKHPSVYVRGDEDDSNVVSKAASSRGDDDEDQDQNARDAIANMNKAALKEYAKTNFSVDVDSRKSVGEIRAQVTGLFDQFGLG